MVFSLLLFLCLSGCHGVAGEGSGAAGEKPSSDVMTCTAVNHVHRRAVRFDLKIPEDEENGDFTYRAAGNAHLLPEYMQVGGGSWRACLILFFGRWVFDCLCFRGWRLTACR